MASKLEIDRHIDPVMTVYPLRFPEEHLKIIRKHAQKEQRTRQEIIREAVREWIERRHL